MNHTTAALLARRAAAPKNFAVVTTYSDGTERRHLTETLGQAETNKTVTSGKIGRDVISNGDELGHKAGDIVRVVSVEIVKL